MERKADIIIHKKNHATVTIECNEVIASELYQYFSAYATNYKFSPKYKAKIWDGKIRFFKFATNELPIGLVYKIYEFAEKGKYTIECKYQRHNKLSRKDLEDFVKTLNLPADRQLRPYQFEAIYGALCEKTLNVLISTAGGKSLVIYVICRLMMLQKKKVILICSKTSLVEQMFNDFIDYNFDAERYCHRIYAGQKKFYDSPIIISTWQSLISPKVKSDNPYEDFGCLICDEVHEAAADAGSIQNLAKFCVNAEYRYGFSGTYPEATTAEWYSITGAFGRIQEFATYKYLQENNYIAQLKMFSMVLQYDKPFCKELYEKYDKDHQNQSDMIYKHEGRNKFILKLVDSLKGNTLILFTKKEKHGYILYDYFKQRFPDREIFYIDGDVPLDEREDVRKQLEAKQDVIVLATYGTLAAGWNVKNLMNIVFASGYKSRIKVLQSIGRGLRLHKDKDFARMFDIVDDARYVDKDNDINFKNYSLNHYKVRKQFYDKENWNVKVQKFKV